MMIRLKNVWVLAVIVAMLTAAFGMAQPRATAQNEVTLVVWDNWTREAEQAMIEQLNQEFQDAHPGVTIKREAYDTSDLTDTLPLALTEDTGPDVAMINQGYTGMGALVQAGLLLPLNDYADQYGWWDRYAAGLHGRNSFTADGKQLGEGNLYGVSNTAEVVGVYYHKDVFAELGLSVPTTYDEFETLLKTLKDAGKTPIVFGSLDGWPAIHEYGAIEHAFSTLDEIENFIYRRPGGTFDTPGNLTAAEKLVEYVKAGYFSEGFAGMDYDNATTSAFLNGDGVLWITGSWVSGTIIPQLGEDKVGFFLIPSALPDAKAPLAIGGVGLGYGIRATSKNPDLAAEYIDLVTGPRAAELLFQAGFLPAMAVDPSLLTEGTLTADVNNAWKTISTNNTVGHYLDWTMPNIAANIQELMGEQVSPADFVKTVEEEYQAGQ
jgi:raffinose/stachyose/melibiose transport system substrate-binding protein